MALKTPLGLLKQFGRYRVQKVLGEGGMGAVYLARDTQLDRDVALKVPQFSGDDVAHLKERFRQEARAAATVQHPNICPIFDVGEIDGIQYLTMAFIDGKPLAEWVGGEKALTDRQIATLVRKIALAMHEAHKKGIIHRDLKPSNIMIDRRGEPIVMDFGLARRTGPGDQRLTQTGAVMGSPAYMAPEQVKGDSKTVGPGCDVYSLGVILYELLTHRLPFLGEDNLAVLAQVLMDAPTPPSMIRRDIDASLEAICLKALAKKCEDRFGSMAEMAGSLQSFLRGTPKPVETQPAPPVKPAPRATPVETKSKRKLRARDARRMPARTWLAVLIAVMVISFVIVVGLIIYQMGKKKSVLNENTNSAASSRTTPETTAAGRTNTSGDSANSGGATARTGPVDLLRLIDVNRDTIAGDWRIANGVMTTPAGEWSRIQIPLAPPPDYQIDMLIERRGESGGSGFIGFAAAGQQTMVVLDGWADTPGITGLQTVDGKKGNENETTYRGRLLSMHEPRLVRLIVHRVGPSTARVCLFCDSERVFEWEGNADRLGVQPGWQVPNTQRLFLGSQAVMTIHQMVLTPLPPYDRKSSLDFAPLFNGKDIRSWLIELGKPNQWSVADGVIVGNSPASSSRSYLLTKKEYGNFVLRFEYKPEAKSAGVAIRGIIGEKMPMPNNGSSADHPLIKLTNPEHPTHEPNGTTHWLRSDKINTPPVRHLDPKPDEWHAIEVTVRDDKCTVTIDGALVVDQSLDRSAKFKAGFVPGLARERGKIGFQINTGTIRLRNIEIAELPVSRTSDQAFVPLFNGRDLSGWQYEGKHTGVWQVDKGESHFSLSDPKSQRGWIVTDRTYGDFHFRTDYRVLPGANSGVGLRWPPNTVRHMEIQIADDGSLNSSKVANYEFTGSLYGVGIDRWASLNPVGQWNHMEIDLRGDMLRVEVNGVQTLMISLNDPRVAKYFPDGISKAGRIGLQHWVGSVWFRNVEIREYPAN